jgi:hypothetical protein
MDLIPTSQKKPLPKGFSYPIGAEIVSETLKSLPNYDEFELLFSFYSWHDSRWGTEFRKRIKSGGKFVVLRANYTLLFEHWWIEICAVPSDHRNAVRTLLLDGILDRLRNALLVPGNDPSKFSWHATYDLAEKTIAIDSHAA